MVCRKGLNNAAPGRDDLRSGWIDQRIHVALGNAASGNEGLLEIAHGARGGGHVRQNRARAVPGRPDQYRAAARQREDAG
jgi:hypothetical protein